MCISTGKDGMMGVVAAVLLLGARSMVVDLRVMARHCGGAEGNSRAEENLDARYRREEALEEV